MRKTAFILYILLYALSFQGCVTERCYEQEDCPKPKICGLTGTCEYECSAKSDCGSRFRCVSHICKPEPKKTKDPIVCPAEMVAVAKLFCIDRYEASRPDATATSYGTDNSRAQSVEGVYPWQVVSNEEAEAACESSGKRLCSPEEWQLACQGPNGTVYAYGDAYQPAVCNGIDTFGRTDYHLTPTGALPECANEWGVFDMNGNLWEYVSGGSDLTVRGGAFNCIDSATLHRCDYIPGSWAPSALGFRCCLTPGSELDGGSS